MSEPLCTGGFQTARGQTSDSSTQIAERVRWPCALALLLLLSVVALGHVQGLRAVLAVLVAVCALTGPIAASLRPVAAAWLGWLLLGVASAAWSPLPEATLRSVLYEMLLPCAVFLGAARTVDGVRALDAVSFALLVGLAALAALSGYAHLTAQSALLMTPAEAAGVLRHYPGVGVASTFAALAYPIWLMQWQAGRRWRSLTPVAIGCVVAIGAAAPNRMFWITLFGTTAVFLLTGRAAFAPQRIWRLSLGIVIAAMLSGAFFVLSLHQRGHSLADGWSSLGRAVTTESRFMGWQVWLEQTAKNPLFGAGYGKPAANTAYRAELPLELALKDNAMMDHAHNLLLNVQLQLGAAGLIAFLLLAAALLRLFLRARADPRTELAARAGMALLAALLLKNATDDFMGYAIVIAFWALAGALAGFASRGDARPGAGDGRRRTESPPACD